MKEGSIVRHSIIGGDTYRLLSDPTQDHVPVVSTITGYARMLEVKYLTEVQ